MLTIEERLAWWRDLGSPQTVCAPMVLQSELAWRMLVRRHGVQLCYSPMLPAKAFVALPADGDSIDPRTGGPATQAAYFTTCASDRPLAVQLGGSDPQEMLAAAKLVQDLGIDCIDLNFGCPQQCAQTGGYGAFLLTLPERAKALVDILVSGCKVPITAKIRILPDVRQPVLTLQCLLCPLFALIGLLSERWSWDRRRSISHHLPPSPTFSHHLPPSPTFSQVADTVAFARMLEDAGVAMLTVHGRRREQRHHEGPASWEHIAAVKAALRIPVISNGNIQAPADVGACLEQTACDGVMSAKGLLANPRIFASWSSARGAGGVSSAGAVGGASGDSSASGASGDSGDAVGPPAAAASAPTRHERSEMALEYLQCCVQYPQGCLPRMISDHLLEMLAPDLAMAFNAQEKKEIKDHRRTTRPQQFASLVRRVQANGAFHETTRRAARTPRPVSIE